MCPRTIMEEKSHIYKSSFWNVCFIRLLFRKKLMEIVLIFPLESAVYIFSLAMGSGKTFVILAYPLAGISLWPNGYHVSSTPTCKSKTSIIIHQVRRGWRRCDQLVLTTCFPYSVLSAFLVQEVAFHVYPMVLCLKHRTVLHGCCLQEHRVNNAEHTLERNWALLTFIPGSREM